MSNNINTFKKNCGNDEYFIWLLSVTISALFFELTMSASQFFSTGGIAEKVIILLCIVLWSVTIFLQYYIIKNETIGK